MGGWGYGTSKSVFRREEDPEVRERAVRMVEEQREAHASEWAVLQSVAPKLGCTAYVERQNLTMRMSMRRFTRLTNGFSKKLENHVHMVALYTVFYNWTRIHNTLRTSPAQAAGLTDRLWDMADVVKLTEDAEAQAAQSN